MKKILLLLFLFVGAIAFASDKVPHKVAFHKGDDGISWKMTVDGQPFYCKGVAANMFFVEAAEAGANTARNYSIKLDSEEYLDQMAASGLLIHAGLAFQSVRSGYYEKNQNAIEEQEKRILAKVRKFKDHPAILCWSIGNEFEISRADEPLTEQWESVQRIAAAIHEIDPNHPVTLTVTQSCEPAKLHGLNDICKDLDVLSVNCYPNVKGELNLPEVITRMGWTKPYMLTEYGPTGTWLHAELGRRWTPWGALVELTSTEKEVNYLTGTRAVVDDPRCVGYYCFLWGYQKHGEVLGWYAFFNKQKYTFGAADVMQYFWNGEYPLKRAPRIEDRSCMKMNGKIADDWITVAPGSDNEAFVKATNPSGGKLSYHWFIYKEKAHCKDGSMNEDGIPGLIAKDGGKKIRFKAPAEPGGYRLYVHASDPLTRKVAAACIPFLVEEK